jgi:serine/threonine-protein kinase
VKDKADTAKKLTVIGTTIGSPYYMAPEQAQGLETLDRRADVWALAAISYECMTGRVPFQGNTGPGILVAILTQEPQPPSQAGIEQKHPVPSSLDAVMAEAFQKNPTMRTPTVGALADAVGTAYGLAGDHSEWAVLPEQEIAAKIAASAPRIAASGQGVGPAARQGYPSGGGAGGLGVMADPFAGAPAQWGSGAAEAQVQPRPTDSLMPISASRSGWMVMVVIAVVALAVGILLALFVL